MRPLTTVEQQGHVAEAAYLMKHAGATALMVLDAQSDQPVGIITEADIAHAVADEKDVNNARIYELMTTRPTVIKTTTNVRDAAKIMTSGHFRHLPVVGATPAWSQSSTLPTCAARCSNPAFPAHSTPWPGVPHEGPRLAHAPLATGRPRRRGLTLLLPASIIGSFLAASSAPTPAARALRGTVGASRR
jgi:hypothetical protein